MRLIDADQLLSLVTDFPHWNPFDKNRAIRMINEAPTVEDRPQGEWIPEYPITYTCSICKAEALDINEYPTKSNFCPNCGADMRGDNNA